MFASTQNSGNGIDVPFTSDADQLVRESNRVIAQLDKVKANVKHNGDLLEQQARRQEAAFKKSTMSVTDFRSAYQMVTDVVRVGQQVFDATIRQHLEYADRVRQLSTLSGESAETTSRFIQVLDDYKISADDALLATKALTKEGHTPSIETLAKLSDQYLSITSDQEKNEFVLKNLGKSGLAWVEVLNKGSDAIRKQGDAVSDGLILNQKMLDDARRAEIAMDGWNDSVQALKTSFSIGLVPALTDVINGFRVYIDLQGQFFDAAKSGDLIDFYATFADRVKDAQDQIVAESNAMLENADASDAMSAGLEDTTDASKDAEEAAKALSKAYTGLLSSMFAIQGENDSYQKTLDDIAKSSEDLAAEKERLTLAMWEEQRAGEMTNEEYLKYIQQLDEITKKQEENAQSITDAAAEHEKAATQRVYDLVQERLAADGVVDSGEFEYLQELAVQKGLVSRAAADQAIAESQAADQMVANFAKTQPPMDTALMTMQEMVALSGTVVQFGVNFTQSGGFQRAEDGSFVPNSFYNDYSAPGVGRGGQRAQRRDSGGSGIAGTAYQIGVEEVYIPDSGGKFIPLGGADAQQLGNTINIVVNNPRRETAESSIRRELKSLSYTGAMP